MKQFSKRAKTEIARIKNNVIWANNKANFHNIEVNNDNFNVNYDNIETNSNSIEAKQNNNENSPHKDEANRHKKQNYPTEIQHFFRFLQSRLRLITKFRSRTAKVFPRFATSIEPSIMQQRRRNYVISPLLTICGFLLNFTPNKLSTADKFAAK